MDIYRAQPGSLTATALDQAFTFAEVAMGLLVDGQARADEEASNAELDGVLANRLEVYQAQGMLMVDLGVGIDEAMARLRAHSYSEERTISAVARDIVAGRLILERDTT
jgi:AmiR/NasT family two-component response regulator